jgi:hypothetical protein
MPSLQCCPWNHGPQEFTFSCVDRSPFGLSHFTSSYVHLCCLFICHHSPVVLICSTFHLSPDEVAEGFLSQRLFVELDALEQNSILRPKAGLCEGFPQRGRAAERPAPFVGGGRRPPPLWRLALGLSLESCSQAANSICI